ncbi:MAG: F0F1 ATP synthase subunit delta [Candidatus Margulisiibacteriota bacterium]
MPAINIDKLYAMAEADADKLVEELFGFNFLLQNEFSIKLFFENDSIDKTKRKEYFDELYPKTTEIFKDFVHLIIDEGMFYRIQAVTMRCIHLSEKNKRARYAYLESAFLLEPDYVEKIKCSFGKNMVFATEVKPDLIGGFKIRFLDGMVFDASIAGKLAQLKREIVK